MKKIKQLVFLPIFALGIFSCNTSQTEIPFQKNEPVDFSKVKIKDSFGCRKSINMQKRHYLHVFANAK